MAIWHQQTGRFLASVVDEELVLFDIEGGDLLSLSGTARLLWERLAEGAGEEALVDDMADAFDAPRAVIAADVSVFLGELEEAGLAQRQEMGDRLPVPGGGGTRHRSDEPA